MTEHGFISKHKNERLRLHFLVATQIVFDIFYVPCSKLQFLFEDILSIMVH